MNEFPILNKSLRATIHSSGAATLAFETIAISEPQSDEVVIRIEAAPINPSDINVLLGSADMESLKQDGVPGAPMLCAQISPDKLNRFKKRFGIAMPGGNEGAGTVVAAGANVRTLLGKRVAALGRAMYAEYIKLPGKACVELPEHASAADGAALFINPLTALAMVETMRNEGHTAIIHTAAASNLGQMLNKVCIADGIPLVNIVRRQEQAEMLKAVGAKHVLNSTAADFQAALVDAITETGATIAFDAIGGGELANNILTAMEEAADRKTEAYNHYGTDTTKQVYIYGSLDPSPSSLEREQKYGLSWGVGGFLLTNAMKRFSPEIVARMRQRIIMDITGIFTSTYSKTISLDSLLDPDVIRTIDKKATNQKYLLNPTL